jgi:2-C-methyl-D-erythritol 4-phosphate cytidylyltransferase/2-C-methyl-D-erythritol 2,4-cyclodiphosphate synthase
MGLRIGQGFDAHRLVSGRPCLLGGVVVDSESGLDGHSDGDVVLHALADALLGSAAAGDLGSTFGESRPEWKGAASSRFVEEALRRIGRARVLNVDVTVVGLRPRLSPFRDAIRARIAELLGIAVNQVSVKASSGNGLTDFGRGDGVAASVILLAEIEG